MRSPLLALFVLQACSIDFEVPVLDVVEARHPNATPERNLVCERVKLSDAAAECVPELTDFGERHVHRARVTQGKGTAVCALDDTIAPIRCGPLWATPSDAGVAVDSGNPAPK